MSRDVEENAPVSVCEERVSFSARMEPTTGVAEVVDCS
jgi:hypothetical protein